MREHSKLRGLGAGASSPQKRPRGRDGTGAGGGGTGQKGTGQGGRTFLGVMQLQLLLVVPAQSTFVLSVCLHTEFPSKPFHVVCMNDRPQSGVNGQLG